MNRFRFGYFPNIAKRHPEACLFYALWGKLVCDQYEPTYQSSYGIVEGAMSPSDGWNIFHRWFPRYDYSEEVKTQYLYELKNIVRVYEGMFKAPFINKNNSNSVRIKYLYDLFPDALFIHVRRDIKDAVISVLEARQVHKTPPNKWWGVAPPQFYDREFTLEVERVVYQICGVASFIQKDFRGIPSIRQYRVSYEDFCRHPIQLESWVASRYGENNISLERRQKLCRASFEVQSRSCSAQISSQIDSFRRECERLMDD